MPREFPSLQLDGGSGNEGEGGASEGKVTGIGRDGGGLSFLQSCWPARRPPARGSLYQRLITHVHRAPRTKRV